jgi:hypothetical protein
MAKPVTCPDCSGLGVLFVEVSGSRRQVACGHAVCMQVREDRLFERLTKHAEMRDSQRAMSYANTEDLVRRVVAEVARHLPRASHDKSTRQGPGGR